VAVVSVAAVWLLSTRLPKALRWLWVAVVPLVLAYCLYWAPVWLGSDDVSQYGAWAGLVVGTWFLAGSLPAAVMVLVIRKRTS
jgi:hypothetical protein